MHRIILFSYEDFTKWLNSFMPSNTIIDKGRHPVRFPCMLVWCEYEQNNWNIVQYEIIYKAEFDI